MSLNVYEQYFLELTNRARLDPAGESVRFGIDLNQGLAGGTITAASKQVLAPNQLLETAAEGHSIWMLDNDVFSHTGLGGSSPGDRMTQAGYVFTGSWMWAENLAWYGSSFGVELAAAIDSHHKGLFLSPGHRMNTLAENLREVGIAQIEGVFTYNGTDFKTSMLTVNFTKTGSDVFITGVSYIDSNNNNCYDIGEGRGNISFGLEHGDSVSSSYAGGWSLATGPYSGKTELTVYHGTHTSQFEVLVENRNIKFDLLGDTRIATDSDVTLLAGNVTDVVLLGDHAITVRGNTLDNDFDGNNSNNYFYGAGGADVFRGAGGNDILDGGAGDDMALYGGTFDQYTVKYDAFANSYSVTDTVIGRDGTDTVIGIELFRFGDGTVESMPKVVAFNPSDGSDHVTVRSNIVIKFSEDVVAGSGFIELHDASSVVERYDVATSGKLTFDRDMLTIDPSNDLAYDTSYFVMFANGSILDLNGFAFDPAGDTYDFTTAKPEFRVNGAVTFWNSGESLEEVEINLISKTEGVPGHSATSGADGSFTFGEVNAGFYGIDTVKSIASGDAVAFQADDAVAALDLVIGEGGASSYQYLAADFNQDGTVGFRDVVGILKMALHRESASSPEWVIVPASTGSEPMDSSDVIWPDTEIPLALDQDMQIDLIGVLLGDVDGSWGS